MQTFYNFISYNEIWKLCMFVVGFPNIENVSYKAFFNLAF